MWSIDYVQVPDEEDIPNSIIPVSPGLKPKNISRLSSKLSSECSLSDSEKTSKSKDLLDTSKAKKRVEELLKQSSLSVENDGMCTYVD